MNYEIDENYKNLAAAIVEQAVDDYDSAKKKLQHHLRPTSKEYPQAVQTIDDINRFFNSEWFHQLAPHTDGPMVLKRMEENFKKYGSCKPFDKEEKEEGS